MGPAESFSCCKCLCPPHLTVACYQSTALTLPFGFAAASVLPTSSRDELITVRAPNGSTYQREFSRWVAYYCAITIRACAASYPCLTLLTLNETHYTHSACSCSRCQVQPTAGLRRTH
jgi:hypothetical protein